MPLYCHFAVPNNLKIQIQSSSCFSSQYLHIFFPTSQFINFVNLFLQISFGVRPCHPIIHFLSISAIFRHHFPSNFIIPKYHLPLLCRDRRSFLQYDSKALFWKSRSRANHELLELVLVKLRQCSQLDFFRLKQYFFNFVVLFFCWGSGLLELLLGNLLDFEAFLSGLLFDCSHYYYSSLNVSLMHPSNADQIFDYHHDHSIISLQISSQPAPQSFSNYMGLSIYSTPPPASAAFS